MIPAAPHAPKLASFGDELRRSSDDLLQELEQLLEGAVA